MKRSPPAIVGHSFGGLVAQRLAGEGLASATVAIDPAPFRGVLPLPLSALRSAFPVLGNPANYGRAVALTFEQFRYGWANALPETEANEIYELYHVPGAGRPLFSAGFANVNPWTEDRVDTLGPRARVVPQVPAGETDVVVGARDAGSEARRLQQLPAPLEGLERLLVAAGFSKSASQKVVS